MAKNLHKKVIGVLQSHLRDLEDALEDLPSGRVSGVIISSSFDGMSHQKRQSKGEAVFRKGPKPAELAAVGAIALLTPAEAHVKAI